LPKKLTIFVVDKTTKNQRLRAQIINAECDIQGGARKLELHCLTYKQCGL